MPSSDSSMIGEPVKASVENALLTDCGAVGTITVDLADATGCPVGMRAFTVAALKTPPLFRSAWVTVYVAVHVVDAPGANVVTGQVIADSDPFNDGATCVSVTVRLLIVTFPVFVTAKLYGTF